MVRKLFFPLAVVATIFWGIGCSENPVDENGSTDLNLDSEFGGYTASVETPGFGDASLTDEEGANVEYDDPILFVPVVDSLVSDPDAGVYHLRIVWGRLCYDSTVTTATDWSGSLTISRGAEVLRRVIHFEDGQDEILTRTDRQILEWTSITTVHNDGIAVDLFVPPLYTTYDTSDVAVVDSLGDTTWSQVIDTVYPDPTPITVAFETGPYSRTFDLSELMSLDTITYLDDSNAVAFHAFKLDRLPCPRGFLSGNWGYDEEGNGVFRGIWMSRNGRIDGYLTGHFGLNSDSLPVFFGKWIDKSGNFEGFLRGTYGARPNMNSHGNGMQNAGGWYTGRIYNADRRPIGVLKGRYRNADDGRKGFFQGRWKVHCSQPGDVQSDTEEGF